MKNEYTVVAARSRSAVLINYAALLIVFTINTLLVPSCNREPNTAIWLLHTVPLLIFLPGLIRQSPRVLVWLTFILLGHFMASVSIAFACTSVLMLIEVVLIVLLFISTMMYIRWRSRELRLLGGVTREKNSQ